MKILLLGRDGQVGGQLLPRLETLGTVTACGRGEADLERPADLAALVLDARPDAIVNAAAYTAVDKAEAESARARLVNAEAVAVLADAARRTGALLVHYSTDHVFDGTKPGPYSEADLPNPLSAYGATKLAGEQAIAATGCRHWIFRTSWVFAPRGRNFARTILTLARDRAELRVVDDQHGTPTPAGLVADVTAAFLRRAAGPARPADGLYHLAPHGDTTWCRFARSILATARDAGALLRCPPENVIAIPTADYPTPARRPANSRLRVAKLEATLGRRLPGWEDAAAPVLGALAAEAAYDSRLAS